MMKARNLAEMKQALSHLQLMAQNIMVGTVQGDILLPAKRARADPCEGGRSQPADPGQHVGHRMEGIHPMSDLVQIENPPCGWMQNCNCSPAAMMNQDQPRHEQFAEHPHLYNESPSADPTSAPRW